MTATTVRPADEAAVLPTDATYVDDVPMVRLLDPDGEPVADPDYVSSLSPADLRAAYRAMLLARRVDSEGTNLQRQGQLALWPPMRGQEGAQVGAAFALRDTDYCFPSYRELAIAMARGLDPISIFRTFRGVGHTSWDTKAHGFGLYAFVVGAQALQATGYAMGVTLDGTDEVVLCCLGDGATSEGHVNEAFNFAAVFNSPIVFLVQNNQWAISVPSSRQYRGPLVNRAHGFGMPGIRVDGNDVLAVHAVVGAAVERARAGQGPQFVEAFTYRFGAHTTADDPTRYRTKTEEAYWAARDPLARLESYLRRHTDTGDDFFTEVEAEAAEVATDIRARVLELSSPMITELYDHVLSEPSFAMIEEREQVRTYLASLEGR